MVKYTFPDGADYGMEVSGMENAQIFLETAKAFEKAKVPFNKAIVCVRGAGAPRKNPMMNNELLYGFYTKQELRDIAKIGADYGIEVIMTPFSRPMYRNMEEECKESGEKLNNQVLSEEGKMCGISWRGYESVKNYFDDVMFLYSLGFRGFLVWRAGMLLVLLECAKFKRFPRDIVLKMSVFAGNANPTDSFLLRWLMDYFSMDNDDKPLFDLTMNPVTDLTVSQIGEIRKTFGNFPLDIHSRIFDKWGGNNRIEKAYEIVDVGSPIYFKDEPGEKLGIYAPDYSQEELLKLKLSAVEMAKQIIENVNRGNEKYETDFKVLEQGASNLKIPIVK